MKIRYMFLTGLLVMGLVTGCGNKKEEKPEVTPTPTQEANIETSGNSDVVKMQQNTGIDKSKITDIMGTKTATSADVVITNNTGLEIEGFYTRPSGEEDWSEDYIDEKFTLKDKGQALFYYDPTAKDEDGNTIRKYDLKVSYTDEDESDCLFRNLTLSDIEEIKLNMEDGVPFVKYNSLSTKKEISTLEEAKARMGRTDDDDDEDSDEDTTVTPTPTETTEPTATPNPTETTAPEEEDPRNPTNIPTEDLRSNAEEYVGQDVNSMYGSLGGPNGSEYEYDEESGATVGFLYYDGFTVSTYVGEDGQETVTSVW